MTFLTELKKIVGDNHVLSGSEAEPYFRDWRGYFIGRGQAAVRPGSTEEVAEVVRLCAANRVPIVPQGGNTGLVGGSVPSNRGDAIVLSLSRMNKVLEIDTDNNTVTVQAGAILETVQQSCEEAGRLFPVSLGAKGSCTVGGNLATNAGGTQVIRYGTTRQAALGLEVVTAEGEIWDGLEGLRKDNTGYSLRDLFIGSEGTLGIITAATFQLYPLPAAHMTALLTFNSIHDAVKMLNKSLQGFGANLTGFEVFTQSCIQHVFEVYPEQKIPLSLNEPWYGLLELSDLKDAQNARDAFEEVVGQAIEEEMVADAVIAESLQQAHQLWHIRESIPLAEAEIGGVIHNDISVPISSIAEFVEQTNALITERFPQLRMIVFGHLGDGNLHYNMGASGEGAEAFFEQHLEEVYDLVYEQVHRFKGSISAEHGIGQLKKSYLSKYKSPVALDLMRKIKRALDPDGIMNPGRIISMIDVD